MATVGQILNTSLKHIIRNEKSLHTKPSASGFLNFTKLISCTYTGVILLECSFQGNTAGGTHWYPSAVNNSAYSGWVEAQLPLVKKCSKCYPEFKATVSFQTKNDSQHALKAHLIAVVGHAHLSSRNFRTIGSAILIPGERETSFEHSSA